jgi:hypothetical protein
VFPGQIRRRRRPPAIKVPGSGAGHNPAKSQVASRADAASGVRDTASRSGDSPWTQKPVPHLKFDAKGPKQGLLSLFLSRIFLGRAERRFQPLDHKSQGQLLDVHPGDGPGDDQPLDLTRALEDGVGLIGPSGRWSEVPSRAWLSTPRIGPYWPGSGTCRTESRTHLRVDLRSAGRRTGTWDRPFSLSLQG